MMCLANRYLVTCPEDEREVMTRLLAGMLGLTIMAFAQFTINTVFDKPLLANIVIGIWFVLMGILCALFLIPIMGTVRANTKVRKEARELVESLYRKP